MPYEITADVLDHINGERLKELLRRHTLGVSGSKSDLVNRVIQSINGDLGDTTLTVAILEAFLAEEISHGKNRMLIVTAFPETSTRQLRDVGFVQTGLIQHSLPFENFNNLRTHSRPDTTALFYLNIEQQEHVQKISLCFAKKIVIEGLIDEDGVELPPRFETDYIWVDVLPDQTSIIIKVQPKPNHMENNAKTKMIYEEISTIVRDVFSLPPRSIENAKNTLYKIFRDLTQTAEAPFKAKVVPLMDEIKAFAANSAHQIGLPSANYPVDLPYRIFRLLERALIQEKFGEYKSYFVGKKGIIDRISFSDPTGAHVNARSGQLADGIEMADIYFDTRDTIETLKKFDKLWVIWFYVKPGVERPFEIGTKFEVFKEHFVIHFLYAYTTREVEEHVLSNFKYYESLPD